MNMNGIACQAHPDCLAETELESYSPDGPYRVCKQAAERLKSLTLRPLEWFNLAVVHGPFEYYLHDDFYADDGTAMREPDGVVDAHLFSFPLLIDIEGNLAELVKYAVAKWWLKPPLVEALCRCDQDMLAEAVRSKRASTRNPHIYQRMHEICGHVLGSRMANWVREEYRSFDYPTDRLQLIWRAAACLPTNEAWEYALSEFARVNERKMVEHLFVMSLFRQEETLDWIEANVCESVTHRWGDVAAVVGADWKRIRSWIERGRPLALVALDALKACDSPHRSQSPIVREACPKLGSAPGHAEIESVLLKYAEQDPVPRVQQSVAYILPRLPVIVAAQ